MKIAFVRLPSTYANWYRRPILGISYICSYVEKAGYECRIFDAYYFDWDAEKLSVSVEEFSPDIVAITAMTHEVMTAADFAIKIKKLIPNAKVVIGGAHVTALPLGTLNEFEGFDFGVYGEGEYTFLELVRSIEQGGVGFDKILGLIFRDPKGGAVVNPPRPFLSGDELDALPYPAFHHYYGTDKNALAGSGSQYVVISSRGCPYDCVFCMQALGRKMRRRSFNSILGEIQYAISNYGANNFSFADEIFLVNDKKTVEVLNAMIDSGISRQIRWNGLTRVNFVTREIIDLAKKAGCYRLEIGVESGDDGILAQIGKRITVDQISKAVRIIKESGISLGTYYILGHPNETEATLKKTVNLAVALNTDTIAVGIMVPYPGTKVYQMALAGEGGYRLLSKNWGDYDKYGGKALGIEGIPHERLVSLQKMTLLRFYIENFRFVDLLAYLWEKRKAMFFLLYSKFKGG